MTTTKNNECVTLQVKMIDVNGNIISENTYENDLVVATGLALRAGLLGDVSSPIALNAIAVGTGTTTPSSSQTSLVTEVVRIASTNTLVTTTTTNDTLQLTGTITFTTSYAISEIGTFNSTTASSGTMYSRDVIGPYNVVSGTILQFTINFVQSS